MFGDGTISTFSFASEYRNLKINVSDSEIIASGPCHASQLAWRIHQTDHVMIRILESARAFFEDLFFCCFCGQGCCKETVIYERTVAFADEQYQSHYLLNNGNKTVFYQTEAVPLDIQPLLTATTDELRGLPRHLKVFYWGEMKTQLPADNIESMPLNAEETTGSDVASVMTSPIMI